MTVGKNTNAEGLAMYKILLSWRYLKSRYIALASIVSVTLGVATLIVVNSVMAGFSDEMHKRLHGILSDIVIRSHDLNGLPDPEWHMDEIRQIVGDDVEPSIIIALFPYDADLCCDDICKSPSFTSNSNLDEVMCN